MRASDLDSELRRSAERTVASVRAEALQEADRLASKADRAIAERRKEVIENKEAEYLAGGRVAIAAARHAAMRAVLLARTQVVGFQSAQAGQGASSRMLQWTSAT